MAVKLDRPADYGADGVVIYVAKSIEEVNKARAGFEAAGIVVSLPEAAIEAMFAAGRDTLPIRVASIDYKRSLDVIDELFPPPELELPPLEDAPTAQEVAASPEGTQGQSAPQTSSVQHEANEARPGTKKGPTLGKLKASLVKLMFIACVSLIIPFAGFLLAGFVLYSAYWCFKSLDLVSGGHATRGRAKIVMGLAGFAMLWNVGSAVVAAYMQGWLG